MADSREMIEDIRNADGVSGGIELSEWEQEFVESAEDQLNAGRPLTKRQRAKLAEIWDRI